MSIPFIPARKTALTFIKNIFTSRKAAKRAEAMRRHPAGRGLTSK